MRFPRIDPKIEISTSSGVLRVTVTRRCWLVVLFEGVAIVIFTKVTTQNWASISRLFRVLLVWGIVSGIAALVFQIFGNEVIEFDSQKLTIRKEIHGWERNREYSLEECSGLEWMQGAEDTPSGLRCKTGNGTATFGQNLTEDQAMQILGALQEALPEVAKQLCFYPGGKDHFITLGLR